MDKVHLEDLHIKEFEETWVKLSDRFPSVMVNTTPTSQQYLQLISNVADLLSIDEANVVNYTKLEIIMMVEAIRAFTNIEFTEEELGDYGKLYDRLAQCELIADFECLINSLDERFFDGIREQIYAIYDYNSSAYGIMEGIAQKYKDTEFDVDQITEILSNEDNFKLVKEVLDKLG
jgi:hypothetical protein